MSLLSTILSPFAKNKHPAVEQFEKDVIFFKNLRQRIQLEQNVQNKQVLLGDAAAALKDSKYNAIAKMSLVSLVDEKTDWDNLIASRAEVIEQSLLGNRVATDYGATIMQRAQHELPILTRNIIGLASKGVISAKGKELLALYQRESGNVQEALALWRRINAEKKANNRQQLMAGIWTRAMNEQLTDIVRLEILEPRNVLVVRWKVLVERMARGEDVAQDLAALKKPIANALTLKLAEFAKATFGMAVAI